MAQFEADFTNYKDRVGSRVTPGRYRMTVADAELDKSSQGNQMVNVWLTVDEGDFAGSTVIDRLVLTDKSLFRLVGFLQALGIPVPRKRLKFDTRQFIGRHVDVDVDDDEPYNGRVKSVVRGYFRIAGSENGSSSEGAGDIPMTDEERAENMAVFDETGEVPEDVDLEKIDLG